MIEFYHFSCVLIKVDEMENSYFATDFENVWKDWMAKQNDQGVIYYVNNTMQVTSWSHPYFKKILEELDVRYNEVKYAAYRTSLKLKDLMYHIGLSWIQLAAVKHAFVDLPLGADDYLSYNEALSVIQSILHVSDKQNHRKEDKTIAADLILNLMMSLYDVNRCGKLLNRSVRHALVTLCSDRLGEKYQYFFASVKDENQNVSREKLYYLLDDLMQFPYIVKEGESFGRNVVATCDSCFKMAGDSSNERITCESFYLWLNQDPQTIVWLPTLHRILATETVQHNVSCSFCEAAQITGLRYRCLHCLKYELCQRCFLCGQTSQSHNLKHPVREYCLPATIKDSTKALLTILKNKLKRQNKQARVSYLPVNAFTENNDCWGSRSTENNIAACNSSSLDSGLAVGSVHDDGVVIKGRDSLLYATDYKVTACNKTVEILGQPCNTNSPLIGGFNQNLAVLSKRDIEIQQQQMMLRIEQLQKENRMLQSKLNTIYKYCDAELTVQESDVEDPLKEITSDVPMSPIVHEIASVSHNLAIAKRHHTEENYNSSSVSEQEIDIHHIIGTFTPVRSAELGTPSQRNIHYERSGLPSIIEQNCSLTPNNHKLKSVAVSTFIESINNESCQANLTESTLHNGRAYRLSDMTLNFQNTLEQSNICEESLLQENNSLQLVNEAHQYSKPTSDLKLVKYSAKSSPTTLKSNTSSKLSLKLSPKRENQQQPCLIFSSSSLKSEYDSVNLRTSSISLKGDSDNMNNEKINPFGKKLHKERNEDDNFVELSEIIQYDQTLLHSNEPTPAQMRTSARRGVMEPVHMSTPVRECGQHLVTAQSLLKKKCALPKLSAANTDKESISMTTSRKDYKYPQSEYIDKTPLSDISWQRKGILMSFNSIFNHNQSSYNLTEHGSDMVVLSTLFRKAEDIGKKISDVASELETHEMEKMMTDFKKDYIFDDSEVCNCPRETSEGSMLAAVHNIGNALTHFVQATEHYQEINND